MINLDDLKFGSYKIITPQIVEVIIHEGIQLTEEMQDLAEQALEDTFRGEKYCLLINRIYSYSHSIESLLRVNEFKNLIAIAIVVYSDTSKHAADIQPYVQGHLDLNIFTEKKEALKWLNDRLISAKAM